MTGIDVHEDDLRHAARKRPAFRHRSLAAAWVLRTGIRAWNEPRRADMRRDGRGRPYSTSGRPRVSVSHDDLTVAVAFSAEHPVGIDVEPCSRSVSPAVIELLAPLAERDALTAWTAYEAIAKADGRGIGLPIGHLTHIPGSARWRVTGGEEYAVVHRELMTDSLLAVAWNNETPPVLAIATVDGISQPSIP
ncbi:MAG: 4'-phosphopantetheinyl transferase family protein [Microbacterium gubbeenense]|uniref:4'-phosphopantetheinyl transferase family protein n=1 Tax=Microbacteriaceae TaxID=85023 RepID=UPI0011C36D63|nr:hypothetical protein [Mycetocola reblochoni]